MGTSESRATASPDDLAVTAERCAAQLGASRDPIVGPHRRIITVNGLFRPFALAGGRAVATWTITRGQVMLAPFTPLDAGTPGSPDHRRRRRDTVPQQIGPPAAGWPDDRRNGLHGGWHGDDRS